MLRHIAVFTWTPESTPEQRTAAVEALRSLAPILADLGTFGVWTDLGLGASTADAAVIAEFPGVAEYQTYAAHPEHQRVLTELVRPYLAARAALQVEI
ncbi:MAG: Dabb family protein [Actinomycetota bacterium]|nr:MAG: Dabb family protein [Actinomycetota bacterium]